MIRLFFAEIEQIEFFMFFNLLCQGFLYVFVTDCFENLYPRVFQVADYESEDRFSKFKMADPIWRTKISKFLQFSRKAVSGGFGVADNGFRIYDLKKGDLGFH